MRDHRAHLDALVQAIPRDPPSGGLRDGLGEGRGRFPNRDHERGRQAALPGAAKRAVGHDGGRHVQVGIGQDDGRVLGPTLGLHPLAVGRRAAVDVAGDGRRADEADRADQRVVEQGVDGVRAAVHHVHHARRQAKLVDELEHLLHGEWNSLGGLDDHGVAAGDGVGQEPEGDHAGEVERRDDSAHPQRLADHLLVDAAGDVLQEIALHHERDAAGHLDVLNRAAHLTYRFFVGLAVLVGDGRRDLVQARFEQVFELEEVLDAVAGRHLTPVEEGRLGRLGGGVDLLRRGEGGSGEQLLRGRVEHVEELVRARLPPLSADVIQHLVRHHTHLLCVDARAA